MLTITIPAAQTLYHQLQVFPFTEEGVELTFLGRLAAENRWDMPYAEAVLEEYRRFLVLALFAGHAVTPSDQVDQVWHLHMIYTHSYWDDLCGKVLQQPLHHQPTQGGEAEREKFREQYARTLESYVHLFEETPPKAIWPAVEERFSRQPAKPSAPSWFDAMLGLVMFAVLGVVAFIWWGWKGLALGVVLLIVLSAKSGNVAATTDNTASGSTEGDSGCDSGCGCGCGE